MSLLRSKPIGPKFMCVNRGPLFGAVFNQLSLVFVAIVGSFLLGEKLYLGRYIHTFSLKILIHSFYYELTASLLTPLPNPPTQKPIFSNNVNPHSPSHPTSASPAQPLTPLLQDLFRRNHYSPQPKDPLARNHDSNYDARTGRTRIGKAGDANRGKPWSHHHLSDKVRDLVEKVVDPGFDTGSIDQELVEMFEFRRKDGSFSLQLLSNEVLGIVKSLGFYRKGELALRVVSWVRKEKDFALVLSGSVIAVVISILGKASSASSLLANLRKDEAFEVDVLAYTSLIIAFSRSGRYRDAVMMFRKMGEEGCRPSLIT